MNNGRSSTVSLGINTQKVFSASSVSSSSPLNSPLLSPTNSPFPLDSSWEQSQKHFSNQPSLRPSSVAPSTNAATSKAGSSNTFVHKLYNMVVDNQYQHLIAWTYTGNSFIVCNIIEFSREVLPKHFKHNNFSSFVRQLNMYGFHKVNKSPRGHRTVAENQIWEFSHPKFIRERPDLLDGIKRKTLETDTGKKENNDINSHLAIMQMSQSEMMQQITQLQESFEQVIHELSESKKTQGLQQKLMKDIMDTMTKQYGSTFYVPDELTMNEAAKKDRSPPPPIYITTPDQQQPNMDLYINQRANQQRVNHSRSISANNLYTSSANHPQSSAPTTPSFTTDQEVHTSYTSRGPVSACPFLAEQSQYSTSFHA
ncbi:HSF-type DNA-binding-domain-containing protein [Sporodiniella umbellata]|nr:HSF-type DNA-binding-domain-containing protein [Sporodiniella umbellata]